MFELSIASFLLLFGYLVAMGIRYGIPSMVSDTYYQLKGYGWVFTLILVTCALLMMACILPSEKGIQPLAFIGLSGLAFVGCAPNYLQKDEYRVHKAAAIVSAVGCTGWCLSVFPWVTVAIAAVYVLYLIATDICKAANSIWYISKNVEFHPWYWAEVSAFADVFITWWVVNL